MKHNKKEGNIGRDVPGFSMEFVSRFQRKQKLSMVIAIAANFLNLNKEN